jgi:hypothetical protein
LITLLLQVVVVVAAQFQVEAAQVVSALVLG